jgi:hypothetical protein
MNTSPKTDYCGLRFGDNTRGNLTKLHLANNTAEIFGGGLAVMDNAKVRNWTATSTAFSARLLCYSQITQSSCNLLEHVFFCLEFNAGQLYTNNGLLCLLLCPEQVFVSDVLCEANVAEFGACIGTAGTAELTLNSSTLRFNDATNSGGGASIEEEAVVHMNPGSNVVHNNVAAEYGGGVYALSTGFVAGDLMAAVHNNTARYDDDISVDCTNITLLGSNSMADSVSRPGGGEGVLPVKLHVSGH